MFGDAGNSSLVDRAFSVLEAAGDNGELKLELLGTIGRLVGVTPGDVDGADVEPLPPIELGTVVPEAMLSDGPTPPPAAEIGLGGD